MKRCNVLLIFLVALITVQCTSEKRPRIIERPVYGLQSSKTLEIDKIELTDSSTVLHMDAYFTPKQWIRVDSGTYIQAGEQKYLIQGAKNIVLNEYHWMPESGEDHFTLVFPPLPKGTKSIDFIESDCEDCFKIWGIDLTGKNKKYTAQLPSDILNFKEDTNYQFPEPTFAIRLTRIKIFLRGVPDGFVIEPRLSVGSITSRESEIQRPTKVVKDEYWYEFYQYTSQNVNLSINSCNVEILVEPGEVAEVYFDATAHAFYRSRYHEQLDMIFAGFRGKYANVNNQLLRNPNAFKANTLAFSYVDKIPGTHPDSYVDALCERYEEIQKELNESDIPEGMKELVRLQAKAYLVVRLLDKPSYYLEKNKAVHNFQSPQVSMADFKRLQAYNFNDLRGIYSSAYRSMSTHIARTLTLEQINELTGSSTGFLQDMQKSANAFDFAVEMQDLPEDVKKSLESTSLPFYAEAYTFLAQKCKEEYEDIFKKGGFEIADVPDVKPDQVIEAIAKQYKGRVVFVDYWATWCAPCLNAMKTILAIKPEMKDLGVVSVYISNSTSPRKKWLSMLPDIGGIHYYLTDEQWRAVCDKYGIKGIPTYMLFDKNSSKVFESTGFPGNNKVLEKIKEVL